MTDRVRSLVVLLDRDTREDDVEVVMQAIQMIRGVATVEKGDVVTAEDHFNRAIVFRKVKKLLWDALNDDKILLTEE